MKINSNLSRNINICDIDYYLHDHISSKLFDEKNRDNYVTSMFLALPPTQNYFKEGDFKVEHKGKIIDIQILKITDKLQDPILSAINNDSNVGVFGPELKFPPEFYTDNKGNYPYYCARINFPYLLADWYDPNTTSGYRRADLDRAVITGGFKYEDKIDALLVLNRLFSSNNNNQNNLLVYEDITLFIEFYFSKHNPQPIIQKISIFTSQNAYKNTIEYFFGIDNEEYISNTIEKHRVAPEILTEVDLLEYIVDILNKIRYLIEDRNSIQPFWDSERKVKKDGRYLKIDGKDIIAPAKPKNETQIQPTLYVFLYCLLDPRITIDRETDEGKGKLDFKFRYTTSNGKPLILCLEFKLAHHKKIKEGLTKQLPEYLKANKSAVGIYTIMWFKDENGIFFKEPSSRTKDNMLTFLEETSNDIRKNKGLNIKAVLIDASMKKTASKL